MRCGRCWGGAGSYDRLTLTQGVKHMALAKAALLVVAVGGMVAQGQIAPAKADPAIARAIAKISAERVQADIAKLVSFGNRSTLSSMDTDLPAGMGVTAAADWIYAEFGRISATCGGCLEVKRDDYVEPANTAAGSRVKRDTRLQNIYAVLKGTDAAQAGRYVLVTGHYDSRNSDNFNTHDAAPGANDDASGVAVSLESARVLSQLKFPSSIVFAAVAGEEQGLLGARHLAKLAKAEGWNLEAVLDDDIVGGDKSPGQDASRVRVFSEGVPGPTTLEQLRQIQTYGMEGDSASREVARAILEVGQSYFPGATMFHPVLEFRRDRFGRGGDHTSFNAEGFAAVRFTEWQENFNHQHQTPRTAEGTEMNGQKGTIEYGDFLKHVDTDYTAKVARLNAAALAEFASAPGEPVDVRIPAGSTDNVTVLTWKAPMGAPAGTTYEVVWRETAAPNWNMVLAAGSGLTMTLQVSKDNVVFGVRSVGPTGHRSPAVVPLPAARPAAMGAPAPGIGGAA